MTYTTTTTYDPLPDLHPNTDVATVFTAVCQAIGITELELQVRTRKYRIKNARWLIWYFLRDKYTLAELGKIIPGVEYDHTGVGYGLKVLENDLQKIDWLRDVYQHASAIINPIN